jgi:hypothetical protein
MDDEDLADFRDSQKLVDVDASGSLAGRSVPNEAE